MRKCKHGTHIHPLYNTWNNMMQRCYSEKRRFYSDYGGRGISVCDRWHDPRNFIADMGARPHGHQLDRIDNDGNYEPGNCRWASATEQARNKRTSLSITFRGATKSLKEWCDDFGLSYKLTHQRLYRSGWSFERAISASIKTVAGVAVAASLSACACLGNFPAKTLWEFDRKARVCGEYQIVGFDPKLRFKHLRDVPLERCPAIFGFSSTDIPKVLNHYEDALRCSKERCN